MFLPYLSIIRSLCIGTLYTAIALTSCAAYAMNPSAPQATFTTPAANQSFSVLSQPTFSGVFDDSQTGGSGIMEGEYLLRNLADFSWIDTQGNTIDYMPGTLTLTNLTATSANWQLPINLSEGSYRVYIRGTDSAGNAALWKNINFSIGEGDITPPAVSILTPSAGENQTSPNTLSGQLEDTGSAGSGISNGQYLFRDLSNFNWIDEFGNSTGYSPAELTITAVNAQVSSWVVAHTLPPAGNYRFYVRATDTSSNTSNWTYVDFSTTAGDQSAPLVSISEPAPGQVLDSSIVQLSGTFDDTSTGNALISRGEIQLRDLMSFNWIDPAGNISGFSPSLVTLSNSSSASSNWTFTANLYSGNYRAYVRGQDGSNNRSAWKTVDFQVESSVGLPPPPPQIP